MLGGERVLFFGARAVTWDGFCCVQLGFIIITVMFRPPRRTRGNVSQFVRLFREEGSDWTRSTSILALDRHGLVEGLSGLATQEAESSSKTLKLFGCWINARNVLKYLHLSRLDDTVYYQTSRSKKNQSKQCS